MTTPHQPEWFFILLSGTVHAAQKPFFFMKTHPAWPRRQTDQSIDTSERDDILRDKESIQHVLKGWPEGRSQDAWKKKKN